MALTLPSAIPGCVTSSQRELSFDKIDMEGISARCSCCGQSFTGLPKPGERIDDVLLRIRADFDSHQCRE